jgi:hypothetical protein
MMSLLGRSSVKAEMEEKREKIRHACQGVSNGLEKGKSVGEIVSAHEVLIQEYYCDVLEQAKSSFRTAQWFASIGFVLFVGSLILVLIVEALNSFNWYVSVSSLTLGGIGVVGGAITEFIAYTAFRLHESAAKQFNAFHICLERMHRYLVAYKMIDERMDNEREKSLHELVCTMANAPMIPQVDTGASRVEPSPAAKKP